MNDALHLAPPEFAGIVNLEPEPVYVCVFPLYPIVYDVPFVFPVEELLPYELLINVGSATSCAIFLALWNIVQASNAVEELTKPPAPPSAILIFHKLHSMLDRANYLLFVRHKKFRDY